MEIVATRNVTIATSPTSSLDMVEGKKYDLADRTAKIAIKSGLAKEAKPVVERVKPVAKEAKEVDEKRLEPKKVENKRIKTEECENKSHKSDK